ncbi:phosphopantetheine-binding protein [Embleya sp. AB8]|uniref:phosphopantetheine-binding protein n=1 Tax=Embleya sp. AB8 TaxID=3156304 RepID=UPI003C76A716
MSSLYGPITDKLTKHFNLEGETITPDTTFEDLGLDSLGTIELLCVLEEELGLRVPTDSTLQGADTTIAEAVAAVEAAQTGVPAPRSTTTDPVATA